VSHLLGFSPAVSDFGGQDVPDDDQQFAGDGDDGLLLTNSVSQALELLVPVLVVTHSGPGGLDQDPAQFAPALPFDKLRTGLVMPPVG
jgi:hypothetical protein